MRYYLKAGEEAVEISLRTLACSDSDDSEAVTSRIVGGNGSPERCFRLLKETFLESQPDGSWRTFPVTSGKIGSQSIQFFYSGRPRAVVPVGGIGGGVEGSQSEGTVVAPMNGQVVKVVKAPGDVVEAGEIVLILEAMKMENEVAAPFAGVLQEVTVATGDNVTPGQTLFSVEASE